MDLPVNGKEVRQTAPVNGKEVRQAAEVNGKEMCQKAAVNGEEVRHTAVITGKQLPQIKIIRTVSILSYHRPLLAFRNPSHFATYPLHLRIPESGSSVLVLTVH